MVGDEAQPRLRDIVEKSPSRRFYQTVLFAGWQASIGLGGKYSLIKQTAW